MKILLCFSLFFVLGVATLAAQENLGKEAENLVDKTKSSDASWSDDIATVKGFTIEEYGWQEKILLALKSLGNPIVLDQVKQAKAVSSSALADMGVDGSNHPMLWSSVDAVGMAAGSGVYDLKEVACDESGCDFEDTKVPGFSWDNVPKDVVFIGGDALVQGYGGSPVLIKPIVPSQ